MPSKKGFVTTPYAIILLATIYSAVATFYPATAPEITYSGRRYLENQTLHYDWPCFRIAFCFQ